MRMCSLFLQQETFQGHMAVKWGMHWGLLIVENLSVPMIHLTSPHITYHSTSPVEQYDTSITPTLTFNPLHTSHGGEYTMTVQSKCLCPQMH